jgi:hypothetical protein
MNSMLLGAPLNSLRCRYQATMPHATTPQPEGSQASKLLNGRHVGSKADHERDQADGGPK